MAPGRNRLTARSYNGYVLLFEFFPLFVAMLGVVAAIFLFMTDRRSRQDPNEREWKRPLRPPRASSAPERPGRRPSMLP
jgi:hypothetical protein